MSYSKIHQLFAMPTINRRALEHPEEFLGPNWKDVLNFWLYYETLSREQLEGAGERWLSLAEADKVSARNLAALAADDTITIANEVFMAAPGLAGGNATRELIGSHKILEQGKPLTFVPLFLNL